MRKRLCFLLLGVLVPLVARALPVGFIYLDEYAPDILQEMRYATYHNFIGRPIEGYKKGRCVLTEEAARQLVQVQEAVKRSGYSLKVYDCYRPERAVADFVQWSQKTDDQVMKDEFYPRINKKDFFKKGYVAKASGHSRGSTVDLTLVKLPAEKNVIYERGQPLTACYAPVGVRFQDNSIDMGTGFDCFDKKSHPKSLKVSNVAYQNRMMLRRIMGRYGFKPHPKEWWHFTLKKEPHPREYFDFSV